MRAHLHKYTKFKIRITPPNLLFGVNGLTDQEDEEGNKIPGPWRCNSSELSSWFDYHLESSNNYCPEARAIRQEYMAYFMKEGAVPWQWRLSGEGLFELVLITFRACLQGGRANLASRLP